MNETDEILLRRIANHQMLHGSFCGDPGILNGKMGVVIFFFHYARHTGNALYEDFAGEMLDEVLEDLHDEVPIRFSNGLSGIGWGIEYLAQHQFVELSADEALQEIDNKVMERDLLRMKDVSWETGAQGIAAYVDMRLCHSANELSSLMVLICRSCVKSVPKYNRGNRFGKRFCKPILKKRSYRGNTVCGY